MKPLCIDLFCGLGGWAEGFLAEGYDVIGFDIERHDYGTGGYPGQLVIQDVLTLHGSQFRDAAVIVASPPCQEYSYMAMPWKRAKAKAAWYREDPIRQYDLTALFATCFRIQREASAAAGRCIPLVVENVRGAQPWVGYAKANFGSFYLWGDVAMVGDRVIASMPRFGCGLRPLRARKTNPDGTGHPPGSWFKIADSKNRGQKVGMYSDPRRNVGRGVHLTSQHENLDGLKFGGGWWHDSTNNLIRKASSKSPARKAASAQIAKIPFPLAQYIARCYLPKSRQSHGAA